MNSRAQHNPDYEPKDFGRASFAAPIVLVFDLGGVLFDFQGAALVASHSRRSLTPAEVRQSWVPLVRSFETGSCSEVEFARLAIQTYDLTLDPSAFLVAFHTAAAGFYDGALALVTALRQAYRVVSLSNTNGVQWPAVLDALKSGDPFHAHHPSHLSGFHNNSTNCDLDGDTLARELANTRVISSRSRKGQSSC